MFFYNFFASYNAPADAEVELAELEDLVIPAMGHVESHKDGNWKGE
jgi:hypothetical protein